MVTIGFIGAGKMAEAMIGGFLGRGYAKPDLVVAADVEAARLAGIGGRMGIRVAADNREVVRLADLVFLAVKPQQLDAVLDEIAPDVTDGHVVVSIAAGKGTSGIEARLPRGRVMRVMPNIACLAGEGMNVFTRGTRATGADALRLGEMLACCGRTLELPESLFDAVTALSGSGPAFFAWLLDGLVAGAVREGLAREDAVLLAAQTMAGTARLLLEKRFSPEELARAVTSAKGTTAAGREVLERPELADILAQTIQAAARRSRELSRA